MLSGALVETIERREGVAVARIVLEPRFRGGDPAGRDSASSRGGAGALRDGGVRGAKSGRAPSATGGRRGAACRGATGRAGGAPCARPPRGVRAPPLRPSPGGGSPGRARDP